MKFCDRLIGKDNSVPNFEEAIPIVKEYERIIKRKRKAY